jgi:hypothetical protein
MSSFQTSARACALAAAGLLAAAMPASAQTASAKATFAYSSLITLPACSQSGGVAACNSVANDSDWRTILRQQIKLANQKDLFMGASLQCGIVTDSTVKSLNGSLDSAEARATIRVRIKITAPNGSVSYAQPATGVDATNTVTDGIVFCDRVQTLVAKFSGLNCSADLATGAVTCTDPEQLQLILKSLNANAFNFVAANLVSGVHTIEVQGRSTANTGTTGSGGSLAAANAFIGAGSVAVESVRMVRGNDGTTLSID